MKILAFAASNSKHSINKQLVQYATGLIDDAEVEIVDLNDYEMPLFSVDRESADGIPEQAQKFFKKIGDADALVISFAEHNGSYTAAYKNIYDWVSRIDMKVFQGRPMVLLATSPGPGGASNVLAAASKSAPYFGGELKSSLSVPKFFDNFDTDKGELSNSEIQNELISMLEKLK